MTSAGFAVTPDDLANLGGAVTTGSDQVQEVLTSLAGRVSDVAGAWTGQAASNFQALFQEWQTGAAQVKQAMDGIATFLASAATTYSGAEQSIASAARQ